MRFEEAAALRLISLYCEDALFLSEFRALEPAGVRDFLARYGLRAGWARGAVRKVIELYDVCNLSDALLVAHLQSAVVGHLPEDDGFAGDPPAVLPNFLTWRGDDSADDWERRVNAEYKLWKTRHKGRIFPEAERGPQTDHVRWLYGVITRRKAYGVIAREESFTPQAVTYAVKTLAARLELTLPTATTGRPRKNPQI
jgi:hypothetical protein